jgi:uncharacterized membrane protein YagU involved in acid resistance
MSSGIDIMFSFRCSRFEIIPSSGNMDTLSFLNFTTHSTFVFTNIISPFTILISFTLFFIIEITFHSIKRVTRFITKVLTINSFCF